MSGRWAEIAGGKFTRCHNPLCGRLMIYGQTCPCGLSNNDSKCDCTHDGNAQHVGPHCQSLIDAAWAKVVRP